MSEISIGSEWGMFVPLSIGDAGLPQNATTDGYARYTPTTAKQLVDTPAAGVALPDEAMHAFISVASNPVRMRADGTDPTASEGLLIPAGTILRVENQRSFLLNVAFIDASGASEVTVLYGRMP